MMLAIPFSSRVKGALAVCLVAFVSTHVHAQLGLPGATPPPPLGVWLNETAGDTVGIELISDSKCNLFIERLLQPRSDRACKYEPQAQANGYLIFLVGKDGTCGSEPDFEFVYEPQAPLIRLDVGGQEMLLRKI